MSFPHINRSKSSGRYSAWYWQHDHHTRATGTGTGTGTGSQPQPSGIVDGTITGTVQRHQVSVRPSTTIGITLPPLTDSSSKILSLVSVVPTPSPMSSSDSGNADISNITTDSAAALRFPTNRISNAVPNKPTTSQSASKITVNKPTILIPIIRPQSMLGEVNINKVTSVTSSSTLVDASSEPVNAIMLSPHESGESPDQVTQFEDKSGINGSSLHRPDSASARVDETGVNHSPTAPPTDSNATSVTTENQQPKRALVDCAVSLSFLVNALFGGLGISVDSMTTAEVVEKLILPATESLQCRFVDLILPNLISKPTFFVSHTWSQPFASLVQSIANYCNSQMLDVNNVYLWIDIFAVNQHKGAANEADLAALESVVVASSRGTLLVLGQGGISLTRIWCLFELWHTIRRREEECLIVLLPNDSAERVFSDVDVARAQATIETDRVRILANIQRDMMDDEVANRASESQPMNERANALQLFNSRMKSAIVRSAITRTVLFVSFLNYENQFDRGNEERMRSNMVQGLLDSASLLRVAGDPQAAMIPLDELVHAISQSAVETGSIPAGSEFSIDAVISDAKLGSKVSYLRFWSPEWAFMEANRFLNMNVVCARIYSLRGSCLLDMGRAVEAAHEKRSAIRILERSLHFDPGTCPSPTCAAFECELGDCIAAGAGPRQEALKLYLGALSKARAHVDKTWPGLLSIYRSLAAFHLGDGNLAAASDAAQTSLELAITSSTATDRQKDVSVLLSQLALAEVRLAQGRLAEAQSGIESSLNQLRLVCGEFHSFTARAWGDMAEIQERMGDHTTAVQHARKSLHIESLHHSGNFPTAAASAVARLATILSSNCTIDKLCLQSNLQPIATAVVNPIKPTSTSSPAHLSADAEEMLKLLQPFDEHLQRCADSLKEGNRRKQGDSTPPNASDSNDGAFSFGLYIGNLVLVNSIQLRVHWRIKQMEAQIDSLGCMQVEGEMLCISVGRSKFRGTIDTKTRMFTFRSYEVEGKILVPAEFSGLFDNYSGSDLLAGKWNDTNDVFNHGTFQLKRLAIAESPLSSSSALAVGIRQGTLSQLLLARARARLNLITSLPLVDPSHILAIEQSKLDAITSLKLIHSRESDTMQDQLSTEIGDDSASLAVGSALLAISECHALLGELKDAARAGDRCFAVAMSLFGCSDQPHPLLIAAAELNGDLAILFEDKDQANNMWQYALHVALLDKDRNSVVAPSIQDQSVARLKSKLSSMARDCRESTDPRGSGDHHSESLVATKQVEVLPATKLSISHRGLPLSFLRGLISSGSVKANWSCADVWQQLIEPALRTAKASHGLTNQPLSFAELGSDFFHKLIQSNRSVAASSQPTNAAETADAHACSPDVNVFPGRTTFVIGCCHTQSFSSIVQLVHDQAQALDDIDPRVWMDIFAIPAQTTSEPSIEAIKEIYSSSYESARLIALRKAISSSERGSLMILDSAGAVLYDAWCLALLQLTAQYRELSGSLLLLGDTRTCSLPLVETALNSFDLRLTWRSQYCRNGSVSVSPTSISLQGSLGLHNGMTACDLLAANNLARGHVQTATEYSLRVALQRARTCAKIPSALPIDPMTGAQQELKLPLSLLPSSIQQFFLFSMRLLAMRGAGATNKFARENLTTALNIVKDWLLALAPKGAASPIQLDHPEAACSPLELRHMLLAATVASLETYPNNYDEIPRWLDMHASLIQNVGNDETVELERAENAFLRHRYQHLRDAETALISDRIAWSILRPIQIRLFLASACGSHVVVCRALSIINTVRMVNQAWLKLYQISAKRKLATKVNGDKQLQSEQGDIKNTSDDNADEAIAATDVASLTDSLSSIRSIYRRVFGDPYHPYLAVCDVIEAKFHSICSNLLLAIESRQRALNIRLALFKSKAAWIDDWQELANVFELRANQMDAKHTKDMQTTISKKPDTETEFSPPVYSSADMALPIPQVSMTQPESLSKSESVSRSRGAEFESPLQCPAPSASAAELRLCAIASFEQAIQLSFESNNNRWNRWSKEYVDRWRSLRHLSPFTDQQYFDAPPPHFKQMQTSITDEEQRLTIPLPSHESEHMHSVTCQQFEYQKL